jgi:hypothetical protein
VVVRILVLEHDTLVSRSLGIGLTGTVTTDVYLGMVTTCDNVDYAAQKNSNVMANTVIYCHIT